MELNNYRSVTPIKKRRKKITASAALILCALCLLLGVLCGRAISSNKQSQEAAEKIAQAEQEMNIEKKRFEAEIDAYKVEVNRLKSELADANKTISEKDSEEPAEVTPADDEEPVAKEDKNEPEAQKKASGGFMKTLLIIILVIIIIVCILIATSLFLKKGEDDGDDDDEDYDEEYDEEDFEDFEDEEDDEE